MEKILAAAPVTMNITDKSYWRRVRNEVNTQTNGKNLIKVATTLTEMSFVVM